MSRAPHAGDAISWPAALHGALATALLAGGIFAGSRRLIDFDAALVGYTFACLFATFGIVYRYSAWLTKPPTRLLFRRGVGLLLRRPGVLAGALWSRLVAQDFIWRRGGTRWLAHMLIAWGCALAAAVTFPLVFGWLHFEPGAPGSYRVVAFGLALVELPLGGVAAWLVLRALVISSFLVIPGVMLAMRRRLRDSGAIAVQRFGRDLLPLFMLFAISATGLLLWVSYEFLHGTWYAVLAQIHAFTVIATLIYLPFGKLFHVFQRPASLGVAAYRAEGEHGAQAICPETKQPFASRMQLDDLDSITPQVGFDYRSASGGESWTRVSPAGKRRLLARAQSRAKGGKFA
jgi:hypothetical protein